MAGRIERGRGAEGKGAGTPIHRVARVRLIHPLIRRGAMFTAVITSPTARLTRLEISKKTLTPRTRSTSRVEEGRGIAVATRLLSPVIKPDSRISRTRLSGWLRGGFTTGRLAVCDGTASVFQAIRSVARRDFAAPDEKVAYAADDQAAKRTDVLEGVSRTQASKRTDVLEGVSRTDEAIRVVDDMGFPGLPAASLAPECQEAVRVEVRDQRADDATPRDALPAGLASFQPLAASGFTRVMARRFAPPPQGEVCRGTLTGPVARPGRLPAIGPSGPLPGWDFHPRGERALRG